MINNIRFKIIAGKINKIQEFYTIFAGTRTDYIIRQETCAIAKMTARCALYKYIVSCCGDMAIRNSPRWRRPPS